MGKASIITSFCKCPNNKDKQLHVYGTLLQIWTFWTFKIHDFQIANCNMMTSKLLWLKLADKVTEHKIFNKDMQGNQNSQNHHYDDPFLTCQLSPQKFLLSPAFSKKSGGTWFLAFRHSVRPSVCPSIPL